MMTNQFTYVPQKRYYPLIHVTTERIKIGWGDADQGICDSRGNLLNLMKKDPTQRLIWDGK